MNTTELCMGCMQPKGESAVCPHCGYRLQQRDPIVLPYQAVLNNKFLIGRILGKPGGFGITYLAWDLVLQTTVAIKEYFPRTLATRSPDHSTVVLHGDKEGEHFSYGLEQFLREARTLAQFSHPNIVRVREFFQQNNTAYLVMDYYEGVSLEEFVQRKGGKISEHLAFNIMLPILDGLRAVHQKNVLHRDIKPANIYLTKGDVPILLDFGAARFAIGQQSQSLSIMLTAGFAPFEQYLNEPGKLLGAWTDIYACGATLYAITTGIFPQNAINRHQKDELRSPIQIVPTLTPQLSRAIMAALALDTEQRPQNVQALQSLLLSTEPASAFSPQKPSPIATPSAGTEPQATVPLHNTPPPATQTTDTPRISFVTCPHCRARNSVPFGQAYSKLHCQQCGKRISDKPRAEDSSLLNWKIIVLLPIFLAISVALMNREQTPDASLSQRKPQSAHPRQTIRHYETPSSESYEVIETSDTEQVVEPTPSEPSNQPPAEAVEQPPREQPRQLPVASEKDEPPPLADEPPEPPKMAITACEDKQKGDSCLDNRGTCYPVRKRLACIPAGNPPPPE